MEWRLFVTTLSLLLLSSSQTVSEATGVTIEGYNSTGNISLSDKQPVAEYVLLLCRTPDDGKGTVHDYTWMCNGIQCDSSAGVVNISRNVLLLILQVYNQTYSCQAGNRTASVTIATTNPVVLTSGGRLYQPGTIFTNLTTLQEHTTTSTPTSNLRQLLCREVRGMKMDLEFRLWVSQNESNQVLRAKKSSKGVYQMRNRMERQATLVFNVSHDSNGVYSCRRNGDRFIYVFHNPQDHNVSLTNFTNTPTELSFVITPPTNTTIQWVIVGYELIIHGEDLAIPLQNHHMTHDGEKFVYNTTGELRPGSQYVMKIWVVIDGRIAKRPLEKNFTYLEMSESLPTSTISMAIVPTHTSSTSPIPSVTTSTPQRTPQSTDDTTPYIAGAAAVVLVILIIVMVIVIVVLATAIHRTNKEVKDGFAVQYSQEPGNGTDNAPDQPGGGSNYEEPKTGKGALVELKPSESPNSQTSGLPTGEQREGGNTGTDHYDEINDGAGYYDAPITIASADNLVISSTGNYDTPDCLTTAIANTHTERVRVVRTKSDGAGILEELKKTQSMEEMYAQPDMTKKTKRRSAPLLDTPDQDVPPSHATRRSTADNSRMNQQQQQQQQQLKGESTSAVREPLYDQVNDAKVGESPPNVLTNEYSVLHSEEEYYNVGEQQQNGHQESTTSDK